MEDVIDVITELKRRYGPTFDYSLTTKAQRDFLLASRIKNNTDSIDSKTVWVRRIYNHLDLGVIVLSINDTFLYSSGGKSRLEYSLERIPIYKEITEDSNPKEDGDNYIFILKDSSQIYVRFSTCRDRA